MTYRAYVVTTRFYFDAYGETEAEATKWLRAALFQHGGDYGLDPDWYRPWVSEIRVQKCEGMYRDGERLT